MKNNYISITSNGWIDYKNQVLIIEKNKEGNQAKFQYNGTSCFQQSIKGFIFKSFKTKNKWFDEEWWYKKTSWGIDNTKIYFNDNTFEHHDFFREDFLDRSNKIADEKGRPVENILNAILNEVNDKTKLIFELDFDDILYGKHWYEAYIPIKLKNKSYLLTWNNCD